MEVMKNNESVGWDNVNCVCSRGRAYKEDICAVADDGLGDWSGHSIDGRDVKILGRLDRVTVGNDVFALGDHQQRTDR